MIHPVAKLVLVLVITFFSLYSLSQQALASCIGSLSISEYKDRADIVVLGKVTENDNNVVNVLVEKYFKGHGGPNEIKVSGRQSSESNVVTSVDINLEQGKKYLLFLNKDSTDIFKTDACAGNKEVISSLTEDELKILSTGYSPTGNNQDLSNSATPTPFPSISAEGNNKLLFIATVIGVGVVVLLFFILK